MQQLSGLDTEFLTMEAGHGLGHITGVLIVDPSTSPEPWTFEHYRAHLASRLHLLPVYTKKLREVPFGIDRPYWVPDDDFDLDYHLRFAAVPGDGGREAFADFVARIHERPLDRSRPLWESYVIAGVDGDKFGLLSKIHHCAIDGEAGVEMLGAVLDLTAETPERPDDGSHPPPPRVSTSQMAARAAQHLLLGPLHAARTGVELARALPKVAPSMISTTPGLSAPRVSFNDVIGEHRRFAYASMPLHSVKAVKTAADATVNDVIMALVGSVLRQWLRDHDELPAKSLTAMVPISLRDATDSETLGNVVSSSVVTLATDLDDPADRLAAVHDAMLKVKEQQKALPKRLVTDIAELTPPAVAASVARTTARLGLARWVTLPYNVVVSNVAGPPIPLYLAGARVLHNLPLSAIADGVGLNVTVQSTEDTIDVGFIADRDLVPDLWAMADLVPGALVELAQAVGLEFDLDDLA
ncbi:MAG: wax ester/triacylglycerol synthase family O-acyltransferase [Acidimicrobiales bacterium]